MSKWQVIGHWNQAIDGDLAPATFDVFGLGNAEEIMIICDAVVNSSVARLSARVSTDGSTFWSTLGDYIGLTTGGAPSVSLTQDTAYFINTDGTSGTARYARLLIQNSRLSGVRKFSPEMVAPTSTALIQQFVGSTDPIQGVRVFSSTNFTAGKIWVLGRMPEANGRKWEVAGHWSDAINGSVSAPLAFTGLDGYTDLLVYAKSVGRSANSRIRMELSDDGGSSYYQGSTDYAQVTASSGAKTDSAFFGFIGQNSGAATAGMFLPAVNVPDVPILTPTLDGFGGTFSIFRPATHGAINAIRLISDVAVTWSGTGAEFFVLGR